MAVYVMLSFDDDESAKTFVKQTLENGVLVELEYHTNYAESPFTTLPAKVAGVWKKPTLFCDDSDGHLRGGGKLGHSFTRGRKYGWWVCAKCGKPSHAWATGQQWYATHGTNLLPPVVVERQGLALDYRGVGWRSDFQWSFLVGENECDYQRRSRPGNDRLRSTNQDWCYKHEMEYPHVGMAVSEADDAERRDGLASNGPKFVEG